MIEILRGYIDRRVCVLAPSSYARFHENRRYKLLIWDSCDPIQLCSEIILNYFGVKQILKNLTVVASQTYNPDYKTAGLDLNIEQRDPIKKSITLTPIYILLTSRLLLFIRFNAL